MHFRCLVIGEAIQQPLQEILASHEKVLSVTLPTHPVEARAAILEGVDLIFIRVADWDRLYCESLPALRVYPEIIFISRPNDNFVQHFISLVRHYLQERFVPEEVNILIDKLPATPAGEHFEYFFIKERRKYRKIYFADLLAIERLNDVEIRIYMKDREYRINATLKKFLTGCPPRNSCWRRPT